MSQKNSKIEDQNLEGIESTLTRTEQFIEDNQKTLTYVTLGILIVVLFYLGFQRFYIAPKDAEAQTSMFVAEQYFERDSFNLALNGDGNNWGFIDIISDYKFTKAANLALYYAGISSLNLGEFDDAIKYLKKFKSDDLIVSAVALGAIGDAYVELGDNAKAVTYYEKAAAKNPNDFSSPLYLNKAAQLYELDAKFDKAIKLYELIKEEYPKSQEARNAEKNITKAKLELGK